MILTNLGPATAYRMHTPKWATMPTRGAVAAVHGRRVNRIGTPALNLALEETIASPSWTQVGLAVAADAATGGRVFFEGLPGGNNSTTQSGGAQVHTANFLITTLHPKEKRVRYWTGVETNSLTQGPANVSRCDFRAILRGDKMDDFLDST